MSDLTLTEIAARINSHLKRFESDPTIDTRDEKYKTSAYYHAGATQAGRYVKARYVSYRGSHQLTRADALRYLEWLDDGHVGKHWKVLA